MSRKKQLIRIAPGQSSLTETKLEVLREKIRTCRVSAEQCAFKAKAAVGEHKRDEYQRVEKSWLNLARSYEFAALLLDMRAEALVDDRNTSDAVSLH